jgi:hypothetical protein
MKNKNKEARKQARFEKLGTNNPACVICGENSWECIEEHHIAGRAHGYELANVCKNCHSILSDDQKDHPLPAPGASKLQSIGYLLLGLSDLFSLLACSLKNHGKFLIETAKGGSK